MSYSTNHIADHAPQTHAAHNPTSNIAPAITSATKQTISPNNAKKEAQIAKWISRPLPVNVFCINPDLICLTDDPSHPLYLPDRPLPGSTQEADELQELVALQNVRDDDNALSCTHPGRERRILSKFLTDVRTGRELGQRFDDESPEAIYRIVLNDILRETGWSLEAKSQLRMVLDAAMYNARLVAWHYKWRSTRGISVTYRPRPAEIAPEINVLYAADSPSYPSAHSTLAGSASSLLASCFPHLRTSLEDLADNVGMSCLWAGVNYRSDHINGLRLGNAVAQMLSDGFG